MVVSLTRSVKVEFSANNNLACLIKSAEYSESLFVLAPIETIDGLLADIFGVENL